MYLQEIPEGVLTTTLVQIKYDCDGGFDRCGKEWTLKYIDAKKNYEKNGGKHICRKCTMSQNNPMKRQEVQEKVKKTNLERYGATCAMNNEENTAARVERMFGSDEVTQAIVEKRKKTSQERYGADHIMQTEEGKKRAKEAFQKLYGADHPMQTEEVKAKTRATNQERYGVDNVLSLPEVRVKAAQTTLERYGVEHYNQLPEMRDYLRENCPQWLKESWESGGPMKGITRPEEWNEKQRETVTQLIAAGEWKCGPEHTIKGYFQSVKCQRGAVLFRSSYELKVHMFLEEMEEVEWYDYEPFRIPFYDTEGKKRYYIIDFIFKMKDKDRPVAVEVKNNYTKYSSLNKAKYFAFEQQCSSVLDLEIWSNDVINDMEYRLKELLLDPRVELLE